MTPADKNAIVDMLVRCVRKSSVKLTAVMTTGREVKIDGFFLDAPLFIQALEAEREEE